MFPETPQTLLKKIAELAEGDDAAEWEAFVELYTPPLKNFIRTVSANLSSEAVEDAVQDVFIRLVGVLRGGKIDRSKGRFRAYLAAMTRRILIDRYREEIVRPQIADLGSVPVKSGSVPVGDLGSVPDGGVAAIDPGVAVDIHWREAVRAAALNHILTKTAVSDQSKRIYRELSRGLSPRDVAVKFQVSCDVVKQVKSRIDRAVAAVERQMLK